MAKTSELACGNCVMQLSFRSFPVIHHRQSRWLEGWNRSKRIGCWQQVTSLTNRSIWHGNSVALSIIGRGAMVLLNRMTVRQVALHLHHSVGFMECSHELFPYKSNFVSPPAEPGDYLVI